MPSTRMSVVKNLVDVITAIVSGYNQREAAEL